MNTISMNSKNCKTSDPHKLFSHFSDKIDLIKKIIYCFNKSYHLIYMENIKSAYKNNKFKTSSPTWNEEFELYMLDHILYRIFKIIFNIY